MNEDELRKLVQIDLAQTKKPDGGLFDPVSIAQQIAQQMAFLGWQLL